MSIIFYISDSYINNVRFRSIGLQTPLPPTEVGGEMVALTLATVY
ncbi:hypothetical protein Xekj_00653 [Xenorhabdus sp. KJ12.1]|nr:hypothetical protein Xekj_00653 [Xenorhabdus sp. KJ12.1]